MYDNYIIIRGGTVTNQPVLPLYDLNFLEAEGTITEEMIKAGKETLARMVEAGVYTDTPEILAWLKEMEAPADEYFDGPEPVIRKISVELSSEPTPEPSPDPEPQPEPVEAKNTRKRFTDAEVRKIRSSNKTTAHLAEQYGVTGVTIGNIRNGNTYKDVV